MDNSFLIQKLNKYYDIKTIEKIISGLSIKKKTTYRVNNIKGNYDEIVETLKASAISYTVNRDFPDAFIIEDENPDIFNFDIYKNGKIYVQSLSSMLPVYVLEPKACENILDMCAAPGSKTTMIQSIARNKVNLTACELHNDRFLKLKYNCDLQGSNVYLLNQNALQLNDMLKFDKILLDAPCSGSGTFDISSENYKKYFTDKLISKCVDTQKKLIRKAYILLKDGGVLVYSTCSLLNIENEEIVKEALNIGFCIDKINNKDYIKILPDDVFEGFFIVRLVKRIAQN